MTEGRGRIAVRVESGWTVLGALTVWALASSASAQPLTVFEHHVLSARVRASPAELFIPKDIPGALLVDFATADGEPHPDAGRMRHGLHVEAVLRGPAFPAHRLLGFPGEPLLLPPIALVGEYQIDDIRLVHTESGETRALAVPSRVPVHVFADVLVTQVVSRPLTIDEIAARGIVIDAESFSAVEFEATFTLAGRSFPVALPVIAPRFREANELMSTMEREDRIVEARRLNALIADSLELPDELDLPGLDLQVQGVNFESVNEEEVETPGLRRGASIPGLVVIPGSIGFLNQFFSVQVFTANASPLHSGVSVHSLEAEILLPAGPDRLANSGDEPLRIARVGPEAIAHARAPIRGLGPDGEAGTADDAVRLHPGHSGQAELLVEGLREGLHTFDVRLRGTLDGFGRSEVHIEGLAAGSVLVRNPRFSIVFSHPRAVRAGEPYTAAVTVMNTSEQLAYMVTANLNRASIAGAEMAAGQAEHVSLGDIPPGESRTAEYRLIARTTGQVTAAAITGQDGLSGRFDFTVGVDERGVELSANVIGYPDWVSLLPEDVRRAADRVLGQALASATAAMLPPGVRRVELATVRQRVIELAEAGQRIGHGGEGERARAYLDILLDWHGGRTQSLGFDQIMRETAAGGELRQAVLDALAVSSDATGLAWIGARARDVAGRSERWGFAAADLPGVTVSVAGDGGEMSPARHDLLESGYYRGTGSGLVAVRDPSSRGQMEVSFRVPAASPTAQVAWISTSDDGTGARASWAATSLPTQDVCYRYLPAEAPGVVLVDPGCTHAVTGQISATRTTFAELPPQVLAVNQDLSVLVERPVSHCFGPTFTYFGEPRPYENYGTLALVLFSKPMSDASLERAGAVQLDSGVGTTGVRLQPGGRVMLANFRKGFGTLRARALELAPFVTDRRGNTISGPVPALSRAASQGVAIDGRVIGMDGQPVANIPVTLTMHDTTTRCMELNVRSAQVMSDPEGRFTFDFVMAGVPYSVSATDIRGLSDAAAALLREAAPTGEFDAEEIAALTQENGAREVWEAEGALGADRPGSVLVAQSVDRAVIRDSIALDSLRMGSTIPVVLRFRGRATVSGTVYASDGVTPVAGAAVNLFPDEGTREHARGMFSRGDGRFEFAGVPLGELTLDVATDDGRGRRIAARVDEVGEHLELAVILSAVAEPRAHVEGTVYEADGVTRHPRAEVTYTTSSRGILARTVADALGHFEMRDVPVNGGLVFAISSDGRRSTSRTLALSAGATGVAHLVLPGQGEIHGRVERADGTPVVGARVAGGESVVTTGAGGAFILRGVPSGAGRMVAAGLPVSATNDFVRLGSAAVDVLPGLTSYTVVRLSSAGRIRGRVTAGSPAMGLPQVRVAIPRPPSGFMWTVADGNGFYTFAPLALDTYVLTAPAPPLRADTEALVSSALDAISRRSQEDLEAAMGQILPNLTTLRPATPERTPPQGFGGTMATLTADGQTVVADINYLPEGLIGGRVLNHLDAPISARVELSAPSLDKYGAMRVMPLGFTYADPATGEFRFPGIEIGPYTVVARSPYYPDQVSVTGLTSLADRDADDLELRFPAPGPTGARLRGIVMRDGVHAGPGVQVQINGPAYTITTTTTGTFDTQVELAAGLYRLTAVQPSTGRTGHHEVWLRAGQPLFVEITLLSVSGELDVTVNDALGAPVNGADLTVRRLGLPAVSRTDVTTAGLAQLRNLIEGRYGVTACRMIDQTRLCASGSVDVPPSPRATLPLRLVGAGSIEGRYVASDGVTPVPDAQVVVEVERLGEVALAVTDAVGQFSLAGIPVGRVTITGRNAVTGRSARAVMQMASPSQVLRPLLREDPLGDVIGGVIATSGVGFVPAASVTLRPSSSLFPPRTVTTDPGGQFLFPGVPPGPFALDASLRVQQREYRGSIAAAMPANPVELRVDVPLARRGSATVRVRGPNGAAEIARVDVAIDRFGDTNPQGVVTFTDLPMGLYTAQARSLAPGRTRSAGRATFLLSEQRDVQTATVVLSGVGGVEGVVRTALSAPVPAAQVTIEQLGVQTTTLTDDNGEYAFTDLAPGYARVRARLGSLAGARTATVVSGQTAHADITLATNGDLVGRLVRADGETPVPFTDVVLDYVAPPPLSGTVRIRTSSTAQFAFRALPVGPFTLRASVQGVDGALALEGTIVAGLNDLGDVALDELRPVVEATVPVDGATQVAGDARVFITFSEAMDPAFDDENAALVVDAAGVRVDVDLDWLTTGGVTDTLRISPVSPCPLTGATGWCSEAIYDVVILGPRQLGLNGSYAGPGPVDMAERPLASPFVMRFATRDGVAPALVSFTPGDGAEQLDPSAVVRLTVTEPVARGSVQMTLTDLTAQQAVPARLDFGLDDRLVVLTPLQFLQSNRRYGITLSALTDRAGNTLAGLPSTRSFATVDTVGPTIALLTVNGGSAIVAGAEIGFTAVVSPPESPIQIQARADNGAFVLSAPGSPSFALTVGAAGTTAHVRARAIDRFGNFGPLYEQGFAVSANAPPVVALARPSPASGPLRTGQSYVFEANATDDSRVARTYARMSGAVSQESNVLGGAQARLVGQVPRALGPGSTVTVFGRAHDNSGLVATATLANLAIADGVAPDLVLTAPTHTIQPGETIAIRLEADDAFGVDTTTLVVADAATFSEGGPHAGLPIHTDETFEVTIPVTATSEDEVYIEASAIDAAGNERIAIRRLAVADVVAPMVTALSPPDGATQVSVTGAITAQFSEPVVGVSGTSFFLTTGGAPVPATVTVAPNRRSATLLPTVALAALTSYEVVLTTAIEDDTGLEMEAEHRSDFATENRDSVGPRLLALRPAHTSTGAPIPLVIEAEFDEPIRLSSLQSSNLVIRSAAGGPALTPYLSYTSNDRIARFAFYSEVPTLFTTYTATLSGQPTDAAQNVARGLSGQPWAPVNTRFRTGGASLVTAVAGQVSDSIVVEGHAATARLVPDQHVRLTAADWWQNGASRGRSWGASPVITLAPPALPDTSPGTLTVLVHAIDQIGRTHVLPPHTVVVAPRGGDDDGDGMTNGAEASAGTDPWVDDAADDPDQDGLDNADEVAGGTDPNDPDSDDDGVLDGVDLSPLGGNRPPWISLETPASGASGASFSISYPSRAFVLPTAIAPAALTVELWTWQSTSNLPSTIIGSGSVPRALNIARGSDGRFRVQVNTTSGASSVFTAQTATPMSGWHHVAATYDGARLRLYVDGRREVDQAVSGTLDWSPGALRVASDFTGYLDELRVWSYARPASDLLRTMNVVLRGEHAGLVAAYGLEASGSMGVDATNHGFSVTPVDVYATSAATNVHLTTRAIGMTTGSQALYVNSGDVDGSSPTLRVSRLPEHGRLFDTSASPQVEITSNAALSTYWRYLTYQSEPGYSGSDVVELTASDSALSAPLSIVFTTPPAKTWLGTHATAPSAWSEGSNWSPAGVPAQGDAVVIPAGAPAVSLQANATVAGLYVGAGATLSVAATRVLTVNGHVVSDGVVTGDGVVALNGADSVLRGRLRHARVSNTVRVGGETRISGDLELTSGRLDVAAETLLIDGNLTVGSGSNGLQMTNAGGLADVQGNVSWASGNSYISVMSAGVLRGHARFDVTGRGFVASGSHTVELVGATSTITQSYAGANGSRFRNLTVTSPRLYLLAPAVLGTPPLWLYASGSVTLGQPSVTLGQPSQPTTIIQPSAPIGIDGDLLVHAGSALSVAALSVGGALDVRALASVAVASGDTTIGGAVTVAPNASFQGNRVVLQPTVATTQSVLWQNAGGFTDLVVRRPITLTAPLVVPRDLSLEYESPYAYAIVTLAGHPVRVGRHFTVGNQAGLEMRNAGEVLTVEGNTTWAPTTQGGVVDNGTWRFHGHVVFSGAVLTSGGHRVQMAGASTTLSQTNAVFTTRALRHLEIHAANVTIQPPANAGYPSLCVTGNLTVGPSGTTGSLASGGDVQVGGEVLVGATSSWLTTDQVTVGGLITVAPGGSASIGRLALRSPAVSTTESLTWTPSSGLSITDLWVQRPITLGGNLVVLRDMFLDYVTPYSYAMVTLNGRSITVGRHFTSTGQAGLFMRSAQDVLNVSGDFNWGSPHTLGLMDEGRWYLRGNVQLTSRLQVSGGHRTLMLGAGSSIDVYSSTSVFRHLDILAGGIVIQPHAGVSVDVTGDLTVGAIGEPSALISDGGEVRVAGDVWVELNSSWTSNHQITAGGDIDAAGTLTTNRLALQHPTVAQTASLLWTPSPTVQMNDLLVRRPVTLGRSLSVPNDVVFDHLTPYSRAQLTFNGFSLTVGRDFIVNGSYSGLHMRDEDEVLTVGRNTVWSPSGTEGIMDDGRWVLDGNLLLTAATQASGAHRVVMTGTATVDMRGASNSTSLRHLDIEGGSVVVAPPQGSGTVSLNVTGDLTVGAIGVGGALQSDGGEVWVGGDAWVESGSSWTTNHEIRVGGVAEAASGALLEAARLSLHPVASTAVAVSWMPSPSIEVADVYIRRPVTLLAALSVSRDLILEYVSPYAQARLNMNGSSVTVGRNLAVSGQAGIDMRNAGEVLEVAGNTTWAPTGSYGTLDNGRMLLRGRLDVTTNNQFAPTGQHEVELAGAPGAVRMALPGSGGNRFHRLRVTGASVAVEARSSGSSGPDVYVASTLVIRGTGASATAALSVPSGRALTVGGGVDVQQYGALDVGGTLITASCTRDSTAQVTGTYACP